MATVALTSVAGPYLNEDTTPQLTNLTWTALATSSNTVDVSKLTLLIVRNTNATTAATVTITSTHDAYGRLANITTFSVTAQEEYARFFLPGGWESSVGGGTMSLVASASGLEACAIQFS